MVSFLRDSAGGKYSYAVVTPLFGSGGYVLARQREDSANTAQCYYPSAYTTGVTGRLYPYVGVDLEPLASPVITYDDNNDLVTITAEEGTEIYYTISNSSTPDIEPTLIEIMKGNTKIKKYTGSFKSNAQLQFIIRAIAVKYKQKCSVESCEHFDVYVNG